MDNDPWSRRNKRLENPTPAERQKQAAKELQQRITAASKPKPKVAPEKPYKPYYGPR